MLERCVQKIRTVSTTARGRRCKAIEAGVEDQQRGNQREGTQRDKTGDCDDRNAAAYGTEQRRKAQRDQRADGGGHSLAAPESEKAGFDVSADDGQHTSRMEPCVGRKIQGNLNGKQALQQIAGQRENPPGQSAKSGHIGGAGIAASRRPGSIPLHVLAMMIPNGREPST